MDNITLIGNPACLVRNGCFEAMFELQIQKLGRSG